MGPGRKAVQKALQPKEVDSLQRALDRLGGVQNLVKTDDGNARKKYSKVGLEERLADLILLI